MVTIGPGLRSVDGQVVVRRHGYEAVQVQRRGGAARKARHRWMPSFCPQLGSRLPARQVNANLEKKAEVLIAVAAAADT